MSHGNIVFDLVKIGNINNVNFVDNYVSVNFYYDINIEDLEFLFIDIYNEFIPFKILKIEEKGNKIDLILKDIDLLKSFKTVKFKVYIEKNKFNDIIIDENDVNINNFDVFDRDNIYCGYVSNVYDYPGNRCLEVCKDDIKKLLPFIDNFVINVDIKNCRIIINSIKDLT